MKTIQDLSEIWDTLEIPENSLTEISVKSINVI